MSIIPRIGELPVRERRRSRWHFSLVVIGLLLVAVLCSFLWMRLRRVEDQLQASSGQVELLVSKQESINSDLRRSLEQTQTAREQTRVAEERAVKSEQAQTEAVQQAAAARAARTAADQQVVRAEQQTQIARAELDQIRKTREEELNRMQEALAKVVATQRTADGMVIDLSNDSFKFDFDKSTLRPENRELLSRMAGILLASHGFRLHIYGYTDDVGNDAYNQGLSERRAQAVCGYLAKAGIPGDIMTTRGFGKSSPRVKATTLEARERNRRVEIGIVDTVIKYSGQAQ
jgi:outer membrane protein OmpA-like peptidoglycan-associated protein